MYPFILALSIFIYSLISLPRIKGFLAEKAAATALAIEKRRRDIVMNDVYIPAYDGLYTQLDHLLIRGNNLFVIETKSYTGRIEGNSRRKFWIGVGKTGQRRLYNPIRQNSYHISMLGSNANLPEGTRIHSVVCLGVGAKADINTRTCICTPLNLGKAIRRKTGHRYAHKDTEEIGRAIKSIIIEGGEAKEQHKKNVNANTRAVKKGICPRCGGKLLYKRGRKGRYMICQRFPACRFRTRKS